MLAECYIPTVYHMQMRMSQNDAIVFHEIMTEARQQQRRQEAAGPESTCRLDFVKVQSTTKY